MNALNINSYKIISQLANLTTVPIHNLISVQSTCKTRSSSAVTLDRPFVSSSLQNTNCSFSYALLFLWNQLPSSFRQPHSVHQWLNSAGTGRNGVPPPVSGVPPFKAAVPPPCNGVPSPFWGKSLNCCHQRSDFKA